MGRVEVHATRFLSPVLMGFDGLCELGSSGFLSIDVQLGQPLFILSDVKLDVSNKLIFAGWLGLSVTRQIVLSTSMLQIVEGELLDGEFGLLLQRM